jgi:hypothetical protein
MRLHAVDHSFHAGPGAGIEAGLLAKFQAIFTASVKTGVKQKK